MKPVPLILLALIGCSMARHISYYTDRGALVDRYTGEQSAKLQQTPSAAPAVAPVAAAKASIPSRVQCGKNAQKRLADPNDPGKFYMCNFSGAHQIWIMYSFDCPKGTRFDQDGQKCVSGNLSRPQVNHGFSNQNMNFQKVLSDRVMAKINAMLKANATRGHGDNGMSQFQPQQIFPEQPASTTASPIAMATNTPNLNTMWANHVKNYMEWKNKGGAMIPTTTTAKYPQFGAPVYPYMPSFATPTATTTTTTTTTLAPPIKMPQAKNFKTMRRIRLYASKINTLAEEINHLVMCMESTENCDEGQSSTEYSSESAGHNSVVKKDRPDFSDEYRESQEESSSNEEEVGTGIQQHSTTSTPSPHQPLELSTLASIAPETKEWNVFLQNPSTFSTESPAAVKPVMTADASSPKSSHEYDEHIDFAQVMEDILRNPPQPFDADHESDHAAGGAAVPVKIHGHTLFDNDTPAQQQHDSQQQHHPLIEQDDTKENANGHRKPRRAL